MADPLDNFDSLFNMDTPSDDVPMSAPPPPRRESNNSNGGNSPPPKRTARAAEGPEITNIFLKAYRQEPPEADGRTGIFYRKYDGKDESLIEQKVTEDFGAGRWKIERWHHFADNTTDCVAEWNIQTGGTIARDSSSRPMKVNFNDGDNDDEGSSKGKKVMNQTPAAPAPPPYPYGYQLPAFDPQQFPMPVGHSPDQRIMMAGNYRGKAEEQNSFLTTQIEALGRQLEAKDAKILAALAQLDEVKDRNRDLMAEKRGAEDKISLVQQQYQQKESLLRQQYEFQIQNLNAKIETMGADYKARLDRAEERRQDELSALRTRLMSETQNVRDPVDTVTKLMGVMQQNQPPQRPIEDPFEVWKKKFEMSKMIEDHLKPDYMKDQEERRNASEKTFSEKMGERMLEIAPAAVQIILGKLAQQPGGAAAPPTNGNGSTPPRAAPPQLMSNNEAYTRPRFKDLLVQGLGEKPDPTQWARAAAQEMEQPGALAFYNIPDLPALNAWLTHVPGLNAQKLMHYLQDENNRLWFQSAMNALKVEIARLMNEAAAGVAN